MRDNRPLSEQIGQAYYEWADINAAAQMLEECKSAFLAHKVSELGEMPASKAETAVKSSEDWKLYVVRMVRKRQEANRARARLEELRAKFSEWQSHEANMRQQNKMA